MEIKYEPVFGPQELFDGMMGDCEFASEEYGYIFANGVLYYCERYNEKAWWSLSCKSHLTFKPSAMRRIIKEPKRWTMQDKLAGRLPEVGSMIWFINDTKQVEFAGTDGGNNLWYFKRDSGAFGSAYFNCFKPIESPEEKAARLRSEWCNRAMDHSTIQQLYDAMLSGELPVPVAPEQNK